MIYKLSSIFSPKSRYVQLVCEGILRNNLYKIEQYEMVVEIEDVFNLMFKLMEKENQNRRTTNVK